MVFRPISQYLRVLAVLAFSGLLPGCAHHDSACSSRVPDGGMLWCAPNDDGDLGCFRAGKGEYICPVELNVAQCFFSGVDFDANDRSALNAITVEEKIELRQALKDTLALPLDELRKKRYAGGRPDQQLTAAEIIDASFDSHALIRGYGIAGVWTTGFEASLKSPSTVPALEKALKRIEEEIDNCGKKWECIRY